MKNAKSVILLLFVALTLTGCGEGFQNWQAEQERRQAIKEYWKDKDVEETIKQDFNENVLPAAIDMMEQIADAAYNPDTSEFSEVLEAIDNAATEKESGESE